MAPDRKWPWTWKQTQAPLAFAVGVGLLIFEAYASLIGRESGNLTMGAFGLLGLTGFLIDRNKPPPSASA